MKTSDETLTSTNTLDDGDLQAHGDLQAMDCLSALHEMVCSPDARIYVHCTAGWNRAPTIVWLYLNACGISQDLARRIIEGNAPDAVPGHRALVDAKLVETVQRFGAREFLPHPRPMVLEGVEDVTDSRRDS